MPTNGRSAYGSSTTAAVFSHISTHDTPSTPPPSTKATTLTEYEHRVLDLILDGYTTAEIAATMGIKAASISQTRYRIIEKMKNQTTSES